MQERLRDVPDDVRHAIVAGNVSKVYDFDLS